MEHDSSAWMLCTRTAVVDYFWINDHGVKLLSTPELYRRVADESDERTGYFLARNDIVEMCVNRLDAQRQDRLGRHIFHSLILRAGKAETAKVNFLKNTFAEAIAGDNLDPAAAVLARRLYEHWEKNQETPQSCEWYSFARDLQPALPGRSKNIELGMRYPRDEATLAAFAHTALHHSSDVLLLCAATNRPVNIWPIPGYEAVPAALCSLNVAAAEPFPRAPREGGVRPFLRSPLGICILVILAVLGIVCLLWLRSSEPQPSPASDTQLTPSVTSPKDRNSAPSSSPAPTSSTNLPKKQD